MTNEERLPAIQSLEVRRNAWANLGEKTHNIALELASESEAIKADLKMPQTIEDINATDAALKIAKQKVKALVEKRKTITSLVDTAFSKLMAYEKDVNDIYIPSIEAKQLELKRAKKIADDFEQAKTDEKRRLKEGAIKYINDYDLLFKTEINKKVTLALELALGERNITAEELPTYLEKVKASFKQDQFLVPVMKVACVNVTHEEWVTIWDEVKVGIKEPAHYVGTETSLFEVELKDKFSYYDAALLNKQGALAQAKTLEAKTNEQLQKENASANVSATLQSMATTATVKGTETKALKQKYELDMDDTEKNALNVLAAFVANIDITKPHVKASWFNLSIKQMGATLVALKNNDNKFEFTGIKFKLVDKL